MSGNKLYSKYYGLFEIQNFAISLNYPYDKIDEIYDLVGDGKNLNWLDFGNGYDFESIVQPFLTMRHEEDHLYSLSSTPVGLLLWRIHKVLRHDIHYVNGKFNELKIDFNPYSHGAKYDSFVEWYIQEGEKLVETSEIYASDDLIEVKRYLKDIVINEIKTLETFLDIVFGSNPNDKYSDYTIKDFINLINKVYSFLSFRSSLSFNSVWDTRLDGNTKLFDNEINFNIRGIIEARARLHERMFLEVNNYSEDFITNWERKNIFGDYENAYKYSLKKFDNTRLALSGLMHSLLGEIDISVMNQEYINVFFIEDIFPWFRIQNYNFEYNSYLTHFRETNRILAKITDFKLAGIDSKWSEGFLLRNIYFSIETIFKNNLTQMYENFRNQFTNQDIPLAPMSKFIAESSLFIEYSDRLYLVFKNFTKEEEMNFVKQYIFYLLDMIDTGICMSILKIDTFEHPTGLINKFKQTVLEYTEGEIQSNILDDVNNLFSKDFINRFAPIDLKYLPVVDFN